MGRRERGEERREKREEMSMGFVSGIFGLKVGLLFHRRFTLFLSLYYMFDLYEKSSFYFLIMVLSLHLNTIPPLQHCKID